MSNVIDRRKDAIPFEFRSLTYEEWILALWQNLPDCVKRMREEVDKEGRRFVYTFNRFEDFEIAIRHMLIPNMQQSISHLVLKTAWEGENMDKDGTWKQGELQKALQLDSYYATMVRGACVKVPLTPDIWCAHNEMEHTGHETTHFFNVMWQARQAADCWFCFLCRGLRTLLLPFLFAGTGHCCKELAFQHPEMDVKAWRCRGQWFKQQEKDFGCGRQ